MSNDRRTLAETTTETETHTDTATQTGPAPTVLVTSLPSQAAARLRRWGFATVLVATHLLLAAAGWALTSSGVLPGAAESTATSTPDSSLAAVATDVTAGTEAEDAGAAPATVAAAATAAVDGQTGAALPAAASRFVDTPTLRVVDTRNGSALEPGQQIAVDLSTHLDATTTAVALSVSALDAASTGAVTAELDAGPVTVFTATGPMTGGFVIVPRASVDTLTLVAGGGGHLVVDVVGLFTPSGPTAGGRFIPVAPQPIGRLWTETQGNQATLTPAADGALPDSGVGSVLVRIKADVGDNGGRVQVGTTPATLDAALVWSPTTEGDRSREGITIVTLDELGQFSLDYQGGAELNVDLLGYVTAADAAVSTTGLFVPVPSTALVAGTLDRRAVVEFGPPPSVPDGLAVAALFTTVTGAATDAGSLLTYNVETGQPRSATLHVGGGDTRTAATVVPLDADGRALVVSDVDTSIRLETTGYFLA